MRLIIGLGSGRCGTTSLSVLLNAQPNTSSTHEFCFLPWEFNQPYWDRVVGKLTSGKPPYDRGVVADCGYYWMNHVDKVVERFPDVKFLYLWRDRKEVIESMWEFTRGLNTYPDNPLNPYKIYNANRKNAIGLMWDDYKKMAEGYKKKYPDQFYVIGMDSALNDGDSQRKMLEFAGYEQPVVWLGVKRNARK